MGRYRLLPSTTCLQTTTQPWGHGGYYPNFAPTPSPPPTAPSTPPSSPTSGHWKTHLRDTPPEDLVAWVATAAKTVSGYPPYGIAAAHARRATTRAGHSTAPDHTTRAIAHLWGTYLPSIVPGRGPTLGAAQAHATATMAAPWVGQHGYTKADEARLTAPWAAVAATLTTTPDNRKEPTT